MKEALYLLKVGKLYGFINYDGQLVIEPMYINAREFSEGLAFVKTVEGKKGYIDEKNNMVISIDGDYHGQFSNGLAQITNNQQDFYIDKVGKHVVKPDASGITGFNSSGFAVIELNGKWGNHR